MYRHQSVGKLSSRSLSKIKTKVEMAFGRPINNQNQSKNQAEVVPSRTNSIKSLVKGKYQSGQKFTPFSTALKNGLLQTNRKTTPIQIVQISSKNKLTDHKQETIYRQLQFAPKSQTMTCKNLIKNEVIMGYSWFHKQDKLLTSVCKKNNTSLLRYFALNEQENGKTVKKIIAAIEDDLLYAGNKKIMAIKSNAEKLINKSDTLKVSLKNTDFVLVVEESIMNFSNLNRLILDIYDLIGDGVHNLDALVKILGRKLMEGSSKHTKNKEGQLFILLILVENRVDKLKNARK